jgi:hypothetical protein
MSHPLAIFSTTGGNRASEPLLRTIQEQIRECATRSGYPHPLQDSSRRLFDAESGKILHRTMQITPAEASSQAVWSFLACIMLPDVVRWRFPGGDDGTAIERFLGGIRGLRNTFGRVWWRAYTLYQAGNENAYEFLDRLGEDELVQIMERPNLAGNLLLVRQVCRTFLDTTGQYKEISRSELLRDAMKRLRRLLPIISFETIDQHALESFVQEIFQESASSLTASRSLLYEQVSTVRKTS